VRIPTIPQGWCQRCRGRGLVDCSCYDDGDWDSGCDWCDGYGEIDCKKCDGTGVEE